MSKGGFMQASKKRENGQSRSTLEGHNCQPKQMGTNISFPRLYNWYRLDMPIDTHAALEMSMLFSDSERRELAAFFAKRFEDPTIRTMLAKRAGVAKVVLATDTSLEAWDALIREAQMRRKLAKLAHFAAKTDQTDPNLQAVCNLLGARARANRNRAMMGSIAATVALSFGLGGWWVGQGAGDEMVAVATVVTSAEQIVALADSTLPSPVSEVAANLALPVLPTTVALKPVAKPVAPAKKERNNTGPAYRDGRCTYDQVGDFIGYWYAGIKTPGAAGEVITVEVGANVRSKYPNLKNGFEKRAPVRCILKRGDKVKLTAAPILVSGDHYWVPLHHGDIVQEATPEMLVATR
jgi:hypothetical protein